MKPIQILLIEDSSSDALLVKSLLTEDPAMIVTHVPYLNGGLGMLSRQVFDVVLSDLGLPDSQGLATFEELEKHAPQLPIVILTIKGDMHTAVAAIQGGAQDYLPKSQLTELLLTRTIRYAIERKRLSLQLQNALDQVNTLSGLLPICGCCKKIRDDKGYWNQIETYFAQHTNVSFSHGLCPACVINNLEAENLPVSESLRKAADQRIAE